MIKAVLALSYVLAQLGNYFLYLLMLYAAYEYKEPLTATEQLLLPVWSLLSGLGSPTAIVDGVVFIGRWLHLPAELTDLFLETWTVTRYGQVVLSVVGFGFATTLVPLIYFRKVRLRPHRAAVAAAVMVAVIRRCDRGRDGAAAVAAAAGQQRASGPHHRSKSRAGARCHRDQAAGHGANRGLARQPIRRWQRSGRAASCASATIATSRPSAIGTARANSSASTFPSPTNWRAISASGSSSFRTYGPIWNATCRSCASMWPCRASTKPTNGCGRWRFRTPIIKARSP